MIDEYSALLSAIRETQLEHGQQLSVIEGKLDHGQQKLRRDVEALQVDMGEVKGQAWQGRGQARPDERETRSAGRDRGEA